MWVLTLKLAHDEMTCFVVDLLWMKVGTVALAFFAVRKRAKNIMTFHVEFYVHVQH